MSHSHNSNVLRFLSMDAVQAAKSGHPGMPMGMAEIATSLWKDHLKHNPNNPKWFNRDRFILSNGHGSMLLYSLLHLTGYDLTIDDLKSFRQLQSKTPGHPEYDIDIGVETTTGPLGQGVANAVGIAIAEKILSATFNKPGYNLVDHYTYVFLGDGCLMEGISHEACSFASTHNLGKLICFYDQNGISIDGEIKNWFTDDTEKRFQSYGWHTVSVDGHNINEINSAIIEAKKETTKPTMISCKTTIGYGSPNKSGTADSHGSPLGEDEIKLTRKELNWDLGPFEVPKEVYDFWDARDDGENINKEWDNLLLAYKSDHPKEYSELKRRIDNKLPSDFNDKFDSFLKECNETDSSMATRKASKVCLDFFVKELPELVGGSADLTPSNNTFSDSSSTFSNDNPQGNHINYGVREFAMTAMTNGMVLHGGIRPYSATFLVFTDYARNAVRLSALMKLPNIFVYTHDSIALGEDGPTHQPVEQLVTLRSTPNLDNWRPADLVETAIAWKNAILSDKPTSLILSRQNTSFISRTHEQVGNINKGGYRLDEEENIDMTIIASGSELKLALDVSDSLNLAEKKCSVVSMPCLDKFLRQSVDYQNRVINFKKPILVIELSHPNSWYKILKPTDKVVGIETFGESAPSSVLIDHFGFTVESILKEAKSILND